MIRNYFAISLILLFSYQNCLAQISDEICGSTMQAHNKMAEINEKYKIRTEEWRKKIKQVIKSRSKNRSPDCSAGPLMIPIAIHFDSGIVPVAEEQCAIDVGIEHIAELNNEMAGLDIDAPLINQFASCFGANILGNACLEFCIGQVNHPPGYGLVNGDYAFTFGQVNFTVPSGNFTPVNSDWDEYVNIYVDELPGGLLGISNGIPGNFNGDGVMIDNCIFGTGMLSCPTAQFTGSAGCFPTANQGEVLAHELGHYFGLYHIWGDNSICTGAQDQIADTPDMTSSYSGYTACGTHTMCSDLPVTCSTEDMYMNFMSYAANSCMYMFTSDQTDVMNATAITEGYTTMTTKCGAPPFADFSPSGSFGLCNTDCIDYVDLTLNNPLDWQWDFVVTAGNIVIDISSSTIQNPTVCIVSGNGGQITTTLTVSNTVATDIITQTLAITYLMDRPYYADQDGDNYGDDNFIVYDCEQPIGYIDTPGDCNDQDSNINPIANELCDGLDNNCDGTIDEGFSLSSFYADLDGDTFGDLNNTVNACIAPPNYVSNNTDCDDTDTAINPNAIEVCDMVDNNCDGNSDEGIPTNSYFQDIDGDTYGNSNISIQNCTQPTGYVLDDTDCDDTNININPGATEICDNIDNNCDGNIDEGCVLPDCDGDYLIINSISQNVYRAEININSDALLNNNQSIFFKAGTDIDLTPNFEVAIGTLFEAAIAPCLPLVLRSNDKSLKVHQNVTDLVGLSSKVMNTFSSDDIVYLTIRDKDGNIMSENEILLSMVIEAITKLTNKLPQGIYLLTLKSSTSELSQRFMLLD